MPQQQPERQQPSEVSMRDLLASCAAANAVSTPPRPEPVQDREPARTVEEPDEPGEPDGPSEPGAPGGAAAGADRPEEREAPRAA
ncbi:hypothetical protein RND61_06770 [Streptomyces sp. TRM76323]|uniref:Uncharacterized protein n=1 Tax=Streptomyces tamarix TaxID=3078565 RepID=A0ABU3QH01_9ACTN|nr:hypothetical protein [Streptomyces tamarix]MDT9681778.1 hypothetical protein [Streptomyces tamarix]